MTPENSCTRKNRMSKKQAERALGQLRHNLRIGKARDTRREHQGELHVYHCSYCGGWHIGHRSKAYG